MDSHIKYKNPTNSPNYILLDQITLVFEKQNQSDKHMEKKTGQLENENNKGYVQINTKKNPICESVEPNSEEAHAYIGPLLVMVLIDIIHDNKLLDQGAVFFSISQGVTLQQAYPIFTDDFMNIYGYISKVVNPEGKSFALSEIKIHDPWHKFYGFLSLESMEDYYKIMCLKMPEWLAEFYNVLKEIERIKNTPPAPIYQSILILSPLQLIFENLNKQSEYTQDKEQQLANHKWDVQISSKNSPRCLGDKTINPMAQYALMYKGPWVVGLNLEIIYNGKTLEQVDGIFQTEQGVNLQEGFYVFINDFAHIYHSISKVLNPGDKKIELSRFQISNTSQQFYKLVSMEEVVSFYEIIQSQKPEAKKPEWLENFYAKHKKIHQIQESKQIKKSE